MMQASLTKLKRSVHQKAIQNRIMEKVKKGVMMSPIIIVIARSFYYRNY